VCFANLSRLAQHVELDLSEFAGSTPIEVFGQTRVGTIRSHRFTLTMSPFGFFWFELQADATPRDDVPGPPVLRGTWPDLLRSPGEVSAALSRWMTGRRWFAAKERVLRSVAIEQACRLGGPADVTVLIVDAAFADGSNQRYCVPVARAD
jgi:maltose alpha-D-glucosyltransferase/alpha-amylase